MLTTRSLPQEVLNGITLHDVLLLLLFDNVCFLNTTIHDRTGSKILSLGKTI